MNTYTVIKSSHLYGVKDEKKWSMLKLVLDIGDDVLSIAFFGKEAQDLPKPGQKIMVAFKLRNGKPYPVGKPYDFVIVD
jgi:hypothetical protein